MDTDTFLLLVQRARLDDPGLRMEQRIRAYQLVADILPDHPQGVAADEVAMKLRQASQRQQEFHAMLSQAADTHARFDPAFSA